MADVTVKYKGSTIAEMSEEGTKTLKTSGKYCEGDITVSYVPPAPEAVAANSKVFTFTSAAAVAQQNVTIVSGDPDVAAHYADTNAWISVRKVSNTTIRGLRFLNCGNIGVAGTYGTYGNYNGTACNATVITAPITQGNTTGVSVWATADGDIIVHCMSTQNNFGGADYIITFSW